MEDKENRDDNTFSRGVGKSESRKLREQRRKKRSIFYGFGLFGLIGWSIAVPTILGALLGMWLDHRYPGNRSYTLALLIAGLMLGCFNAAHWVRREMKDMHDEQDENNKP